MRAMKIFSMLIMYSAYMLFAAAILIIIIPLYALVIAFRYYVLDYLFNKKKDKSSNKSDKPSSI